MSTCAAGAQRRGRKGHCSATLHCASRRAGKQAVGAGERLIRAKESECRRRGCRRTAQCGRAADICRDSRVYLAPLQIGRIMKLEVGQFVWAKRRSQNGAQRPRYEALLLDSLTGADAYTPWGCCVYALPPSPANGWIPSLVVPMAAKAPYST